MLLLFIGILLLHWIGDFCFQSRWMADNKSKNFEALILHVFVYGLTLFCGVGFTCLYTLNDLCRFAVVNFFVHLLIDAMTSQCTKKALENKNMHLFFTIVGFDQFLHSMTLLITAEHLLGKVW